MNKFDFKTLVQAIKEARM